MARGAAATAVRLAVTAAVAVTANVPVSSVQNPYGIQLYWLVNGDPYIGLL